MSFLVSNTAVSQKVLSRMQVLIVLVVIVVEILSVHSFKNSCHSGQIGIAEFDLKLRCGESQLPCGKPQKRAMLLRTLLELNLTTPTTPNMVILYRCEDSGCCARNHERCSNSSATEHQINFITNTGLQKSMTIYNHTACSCMYIPETQECFL